MCGRAGVLSVEEGAAQKCKFANLRLSDFILYNDTYDTGICIQYIRICLYTINSIFVRLFGSNILRHTYSTHHTYRKNRSSRPFLDVMISTVPPATRFLYYTLPVYTIPVYIAHQHRNRATQHRSRVIGSYISTPVQFA